MEEGINFIRYLIFSKDIKGLVCGVKAGKEEKENGIEIKNFSFPSLVGGVAQYSSLVPLFLSPSHVVYAFLLNNINLKT